MTDLSTPVGDGEHNSTDKQSSEVMDKSPHAITVHSDGIVRYANAATAALLGVGDRQSLVGQYLFDYVDPTCHSEVRRRIGELMRGETNLALVETKLRRADGSIVVVESTEARTTWEGDPAVEIVAWEVASRSDREQQLALSARYDSLTGLATRMLVDQHLDRLKKQGTAVAVLLLDLDDFKSVNDRFGHVAGDEVLRAVAGRLVGAVKEGDLVARVGGDEFIVVATGIVDVATALKLGDRLRRTIAGPVGVDGRLVSVSATLGAAVSTSVGGETVPLLAEADRAMYEAKKRRTSATTPNKSAEPTLDQALNGGPPATDLDHLTGLLRNSSLQGAIDRLGRLRNDHPPFTLGVVDIVGLRYLNREFGDEVGDELLCLVAQRLDRSDFANLVTRIAGDKFGLLTVGVTAEEAGQWVRALRSQVLNKPFRIGGADLEVEFRVVRRSSPPERARDILWQVQHDASVEATRVTRHRLAAVERTLITASAALADNERLRADVGQLEMLARRDPLTDLLNRRGMKVRLEHLKFPCSLAFVDLDNLSQLNKLDELWQDGDAAIKGVADRLAGDFDRDNVARWGGDEYLLVAPGTSAEALGDWLSQLLERTRAELVISGRPVTFSAGVTDCHDGDLDAARARAYQAVSEAKRTKATIRILPTATST